MSNLLIYFIDSLACKTGFIMALLAYTTIILLITVICIFSYVFYILNQM